MTTSTGAVTSDAELVERCLDGDGRAWGLLVERHGGLVWAIAARMGLHRTDSEDVFQATWTVALEDLSRIHDPGRFGAWIGRVARHQCLRVRRGYGIARTAHARVAETVSATDVPADELERLEERERVGRALEQIGERCADLLRLLYYVDPRPAYEDIAARLDMRIGSIGPTRARCLKKLEGELGGGA